MTQTGTDNGQDSVVSISNRDGKCPIVVVCEHASNHIPPEFSDLGLSNIEIQSHIGWDPGAKLVAEHMSELLDCPLVAGEVSRLVYDCNRPPVSDSAMPARSEVYDIPGNLNLSDAQRAERTAKYYQPFKQAVAQVLADRGPHAVLVTIHSFTPIYNGKPRQVELGFLHDSDTRLADAMMEQAPSATTLNVQLNQPYGVTDGVTHTLQEHGVGNGILNVMIEIRNDLLVDDSRTQKMAEMLSSLLGKALQDLKDNVPTLRTGT